MKFDDLNKAYSTMVVPEINEDGVHPVIRALKTKNGSPVIYTGGERGIYIFENSKWVSISEDQGELEQPKGNPVAIFANVNNWDGAIDPVGYQQTIDDGREAIDGGKNSTWWKTQLSTFENQ